MTDGTRLEMPRRRTRAAQNQVRYSLQKTLSCVGKIGLEATVLARSQCYLSTRYESSKFSSHYITEALPGVEQRIDPIPVR